MVSSDRLKVGIVGVGSMGTLHLEKFLRHPQVAVVGSFDISPARREASEAKFLVTAYGRLEDLLFDCDAVVIATPTPTHYPIALQALEMGNHVLVEKPITDNASQAQALVKLADRKGLVLQVGLLEKYRFEKLAQSRNFDDVYSIESERFSTQAGREPHLNVVWDLMIHDIDIVLSIKKCRPNSVHALGVGPDSKTTEFADVRLGFPDGTVAKLVASRIAHQKSRRMKMISKEGFFTFDFMDNVSEFHDRLEGTTFQKSQVVERNFDALSTQCHTFVQAITGHYRLSSDPLLPMVVTEEIVSQLNLFKSFRSDHPAPENVAVESSL